MKQPVLFLTAAIMSWSVSTCAAWAEWTVRCSDTLYCIASHKAEVGNFQLKVERGGKADIALFVTIKPKELLAENMVVEIAVPDQNFEYESEVEKVYTGNEAGFLAQPRDPLLSTLRMGRTVQILIRHGGTVGTQIHTVSLDGLSVALAEIDTVQGRAGRVDATVLWGGIPAEYITVPPKATSESAQVVEPLDTPQSIQTAERPALQANPASGEEWSNIVYEPNELPQQVNAIVRAMGCDADAMQAFGAQAMGMGQNGDFYFVPCFNADVNIQHIAAHIGLTGIVQQLDFEYPIGQNRDNRRAIINPQLNLETGTLSAVTYDSPNYDCGISEDHQWISDGSYFELITYRIKSDCDGVMTPPESFPLDWTIDELGD